MTYVIAQGYVDVKDRVCVDERPLDWIYARGRMLYIQPDEWVDCGACEPVCPAEAIFHEDDIPDDQIAFTRFNAGFVDNLGSPGGASSLALNARDHPEVATLAAVGDAR